jgi:pimeloyl-ACP methyl ester carboxylesterase
MSTPSEPSPGAAWRAIAESNGTKAFAAAFASSPALETSVMNGPCVGVDAIASFFGATAAGMYDFLAFTSETVDGRKTFLEWQGKAFGKDVGGATILTRDEVGLIQFIHLYHRPLPIVIEFAQELAKRLQGKVDPGLLSTFEKVRGIHNDTGNTHETAPTQFAEAGGIRFAYRRFGRRGGTPLLLLGYFTANLDRWDPKVTNGFAAEREVVLVDYPGIGGSSGETPSTVAPLTKACVEFCGALGLTRFDVLGFSLGGMIAQQLAADHPEMVRRIILTGTGPRGGEGMVFEELSADELDNEVGLIMNAFFTQSEASKTAGRAYLERLKLRAANPDAPVSKQAARAELAAIREWGVIPKTDHFAVLGQIHHPTLIVHGSKDVVVIPINAFLLAQHLPNAQLIMYPDASHGAYSQYAENFLENARLFLNG